MYPYEQAVAAWKEKRIITESDLDRELDHFRILFAYHSGKIENDEITYHDTREVFENGSVKGYTGSPRALFEIQNMKLCYELMKKPLLARTPLSLSFILEIHRALTSGTYDERRYIDNEERPGEFKKHDYVTGLLEVGSPAEDVERDMRELLEEINSYSGNDPLKPAAYFHARFEYIHPFADGNGRVGRALLNYYLMTHDHPPLIVYDEDKRLYYGTLEKYDADEEITQLYDFLKMQVAKTWERESRSHADAPSRKRFSDFD